MIQLVDDWHLIETAPDLFLEPANLVSDDFDWIPASVPGTVAQAMSAAGRWSLGDQFDFDSRDYWYKTEFKLLESEQQRSLLHLDGLATLCEVWVNGRRVVESDNMFLAHQVDISDFVQADNSLYLCFRSLTAALAQRRARPRWKTGLVDRQQLRWFRTTLLGRIAGWTPPVAPVGPWKAISISQQLTPLNVNVMPVLHGKRGVVQFSCDLNHVDGEPVTAVLSVNGTEVTLDLKELDSGSHVYGELHLDNVTPWLPHTHGTPQLYEASLSIKTPTTARLHPLAPVGFKKVAIDRSNNNFSIVVNGKKIFCRGACWTVNDIVSLMGDLRSLERTLLLMRDAGANMIRIGGTMVYEQDRFYQLCDELGMMVWQDFMFANMDYPVEDEDFNASIISEARQLLTRLRKHVCVTIYCGNSEVEQQVAMLGMPAEIGSNDFFRSQLAALCREHHPAVPYLTSTPSGGDLPFHTDVGVTHYYGVGAYRLPVSDVRQHQVKFSPECLGFSNMPVAQTRNGLFDGKIPVIHHPKWKERVPRDSGAGWDFEDIRDHYLAQRFLVNPVRLRSEDNAFYLALSEIISGEVMAQVYAEWRSKQSCCAGALVWFLKDLWPGAGWGVIDSRGLPKAVYYYLKRSWQPVNVAITDESLNGLHIHINNETERELSGELEVLLLNEFSTVIASKKVAVVIVPGSIARVRLDQLLAMFLDTTYTYRFGPSKHVVVAARLTDSAGSELGCAHYFPDDSLPRIEDRVKLEAEMAASGDDGYLLRLLCDKSLYAVNIDIPGFLPDENFFHLLPGVEKTVRIFRDNHHVKKIRGYVGAVNLRDDIRIKVSAD